ncbi:hypothetical protein ABH922_005575 [Rhodococcus sp. 27YEA15]|uniref:hypothetical protein n=1 Tax=Rhodococcus sp. 27YEA15 TaxID=3156259 RepID=UPI003C7B32CC
MEIIETDKLTWDLIVPNTRGGDIYRKVIRAAEQTDGVAYDVRIELFSEGDRAYTSIRHRHDFEQLRFAVRGSMDLGFTVLNEGDVGYFPANAYYGPQKCADAIILIAQWGDNFVTKEANDKAVAELEAAGEFKDGIYHGVDTAGTPYNKDPLNAIWEQVFKRPYVPQTSRYRQPVVMTPSAFGVTDELDSIHQRRLGCFTENDTEAELLTWSADGVLSLQPDRRPTLLFTTKGSYSRGEETFGPLTGVWIAPGEELELAGVEGGELLLVRFPSPDAKITLG